MSDELAAPDAWIRQINYLRKSLQQSEGLNPNAEIAIRYDLAQQLHPARQDYGPWQDSLPTWVTEALRDAAAHHYERALAMDGRRSNIEPTPPS
ncbi:hypothetical protein FB384_004880 [Prauserella sediminis]|uniref:Uncharacterized protein n=1 Tax=Prauserella sediminis TaxID=577680 RepID=A0A839XT87_9PSEU|nr:hypothetical protein [Prauserella sediminis]MBB3665921.1 hypothetical protein [Prauserella sediminis]